MKEFDIKESNFETEVHRGRGPENDSNSSLEIKTKDNLLTLFSDDAQLVDKFYSYLNRILQLKDQPSFKNRNQFAMIYKSVA